jgi:pSer/pThr/pTyr-binding forkhead associated (FHA) protein
VLPVRITLTVTEGVLKGEEYVFRDPAQWVLGRSPDCDIALPVIHRYISRRHCAFEIDPPTVRVRDLNSANGTYVNGEKIGQRPNRLARGESDSDQATRELRNGDEVRVGDTAIRISVDLLGLVPVPSGQAVAASVVGPLRRCNDQPWFRASVVTAWHGGAALDKTVETSGPPPLPGQADADRKHTTDGNTSGDDDA